MLQQVKTKRNITLPFIFLILFYFVNNGFAMVYFLNGRGISSASSFLHTFILVWLLGWWLREDNPNHAKEDGYNFSCGVYIGWTLTTVFYLFRTRGIKAFISLTKFLIVYAVTLSIGFVFAIFTLLL
jgi:hypothetical protein